MAANIVVYHCEDPETRFVGIYGDPDGLRKLAAALIKAAEADQESMPQDRLPLRERLHIHLNRGVDLHAKSLPVIVGRLDAKGSGDFPEWMNDEA